MDWLDLYVRVVHARVGFEDERVNEQEENSVETEKHVVKDKNIAEVKNRPKTGVSVFIFNKPLPAAGLICGSAPASREMDAIGLSATVQTINGVYLSGCSAFGLDGCAGLLSYLRSERLGVPTMFGEVPVCPGLAIFDSCVMAPECFFSASEIALLCQRAGPIDPNIFGPQGAGAGATVSKVAQFSHPNSARRGGVGFSHRVVSQGYNVSCFVVCNAFGDVIGPDGSLLTSPENVPEGSAHFLVNGNLTGAPILKAATTLCVIFTDADMDRPELHRVAKMASAGLARSISPAMTPFDGDAILAISTAHHPISHHPRIAVEAAIGQGAADCLARAVRKSVM